MASGEHQDAVDGMALAMVPNGQHHEKLYVGRNRQRHTDSESGFSASQLPEQQNQVSLESSQAAKWQSTWELTPKEIAKREKKLKRKKRWERALGLPSSSSKTSSDMVKHIVTAGTAGMAAARPREEIQLVDSSLANGYHQVFPEDIPEEDVMLQVPPKQPKKTKRPKNDCTESEIPKPPPWKKLVETTVNTGIDPLFKFMFESESFFDIVTKKRYDEVASFSVTPWAVTAPGDEEDGGGAASDAVDTAAKEKRTMFYQFVQTIAFTRTTIAVEQLMTKTFVSPGHCYIVDCQAQASGAPMADSCVQHLHYRFEDASGGDQSNNATRITIMADIEWVKPCLFKGRVESEAWSGMKKYYEIVELEIQDLHAQSFNMGSTPSKSKQPQASASTAEEPAVKSKSKKMLHAADKGGLTGVNPRTSASTNLQSNSASEVATRIGLTLVVVFILTTMCAITFAMFKMTGTVELLSERVLMLENTIRELKQLKRCSNDHQM